MLGRRTRATAAGRRTGPVDEEPWWVPADQRFVEQPLLTARDWGRGWQSVEIPNNAERLDPYGDDEHSRALRAVRSERVLTALDEGAAWRHRRDKVLAVLRLEVFGDAHERDAAPHRDAWRQHAVGCLDEVWRQRWREREQTPGWIEVRWRGGDEDTAATVAGPAVAAATDWVVVEDQTGTHETGTVNFYQHLTVWRGRAVATLTVRHDLAHDVDDRSAAAASVLYRGLGTLES